MMANFKVKLTNNNSIPVVIKPGGFGGAPADVYVETLKDVNVVEKVASSTIVYNVGTGEYDIRPPVIIDGGYY